MTITHHQNNSLPWTPLRARAQPHPQPPSRTLRIAGVAARSIFLLAIVVVTAHVAMPQTMGSIAQASLGDVTRVALGAAACIWMARQIFTFRRDAHDHKTWLVLGPVLTALLAVCAIAWW
jgi:hypothetical protein